MPKKDKPKEKKRKYLDWESGLMNMKDRRVGVYKPAQHGFVAPSELNKDKSHS